MGKEDTDSVGNSPTHTSNQHHAPTLFKPHHLPCNRLRRHKHTCNIDAHHSIAVLPTILQRWCFLLNSRCSDQSIHASMFICYVLDYLIQFFHFADIDAAVVQRGAEFGLCALLDAGEIRRGSFQAVECVDCGSLN
jgi:hypothetical protein